MMLARVATESDHHQLARLCTGAAARLAERRGGRALRSAWLGGAPDAQAFSAVARHVHDSDATWLVVEIEGELVGAAVIWAIETEGWFAVYVDERHRHAGIGPTLGAHAVQLLEERTSVRSIDVLALPGDRALKSLLERAGFKARLLTMRRDL